MQQEAAYHYVDSPIGMQHSQMARGVSEPPPQAPQEFEIVVQPPRMMMARAMYLQEEARRKRRQERSGLMLVMALATIGLAYGVYCMMKKRQNSI